MGFHLTFYSVEKETIIVGENNNQRELEYDPIFEDDAVSPVQLIDWKNRHGLHELLIDAEICNRDDLGPWVIYEKDISRLIRLSKEKDKENSDDPWAPYQEFVFFLESKNNAFFDSHYLIFTAG